MKQNLTPTSQRLSKENTSKHCMGKRSSKQLCVLWSIPQQINPLNAKLNPIYHLLALLAHPILHVSMVWVNGGSRMYQRSTLQYRAKPPYTKSEQCTMKRCSSSSSLHFKCQENDQYQYKCRSTHHVHFQPRTQFSFKQKVFYHKARHITQHLQEVVKRSDGRSLYLYFFT